MEDIPILRDIVVLLAVSVPISIVLTRMGIHTIVGFLLTGVLIGPHGLGLVTDLEDVEMLAQIGIVLLLFTVGIEFSFAKMFQIKKESTLGGGLQILLTTGAVVLAGYIIHQPFSVSLLVGFIIALSSSAIVLKLLIDRGDINTTHGILSFGILLFQDICVVIMVMIIQAMGTNSAELSLFNILKASGKAVVTILIILVAVSYMMPRVFYHVVRLRNREVFILTIVLACLGTAWLTSLAGLSLAIGAFIAGLVISESDYSNQVVAEVLPFRDTFSSLFFISIGMLLEIDYFIYHVHWLLLLSIGVILLKTTILTSISTILGYSIRIALIVGLNLSQIGEFSFILLKMGQDYGMLTDGLYQTILSVTIMTMAVTPFICRWSGELSMKIGLYLGRTGIHYELEAENIPSNHVMIVGYGLNGRNLARVLKETGIEYLVIDMNTDRVRQAKKEGHPAFFGDASFPEILRAMGVERAKMIVVAISDPVSTRRIVKTARTLNTAISIIVRTRYLREVEDLYRLGANQVIPEEFETSVEIFARVLRDYRVPGNIIQNQIDLIRQEGYAMLRNPSLSRDERLASLVSVLEKGITDTFYVDEKSHVAGKTLSQLNLRKITGTTVIAIIRKGTARTNPPADFRIERGDILVLLGSHAELNSAFELLKGKTSG